MKFISTITKALLAMLVVAAVTACGDDDKEPRVEATSIEVLTTNPEIAVGKSTSLWIKVTPSNASNKHVKFSGYEDGKIIEIRSRGLNAENDYVVTGVAEGEATVTLTSESNPKLTKQVTFKVTPDWMKRIAGTWQLESTSPNLQEQMIFTADGKVTLIQTNNGVLNTETGIYAITGSLLVLNTADTAGNKRNETYHFTLDGDKLVLTTTDTPSNSLTLHRLQ